MNINDDIIENNCGICFEEFNHPTKTFVCNHYFCQQCIVTWNFKCIDENKNVSCPMCRKEDINTTNEIKNLR
jgi:hypothetical protein